ncbi:MAG: hypothetical protein M1838_002686 [Thelocarpon superellum]|nr:MAG: hypothetical protein M1838_002686 [Thelocarpon superellum]
MIKVAIAGTGGLAQLIAQCLSEETSHQFILLSRTPKPSLESRGFQVLVVNYADEVQLRYALQGVDTVVSTVSGDPQLRLIDAAVNTGVRRFAPAEFEGPPHLRPLDNRLDRGQQAALDRLQFYAGQIESTVFACGVFYERFAPGGMAALGLGLGSGISREGDFLMNIRLARAQIPHQGLTNQPVYVGMTSAQDVARFVVKALDLSQWSPELWMQGDRLTPWEVVRQAELLRGREFEKFFHDPVTLQDALALATASDDWAGVLRVQNLIATAEHRYDFTDPVLNTLVDFMPVRFGEWLQRAWAERL